MSARKRPKFACADYLKKKTCQNNLKEDYLYATENSILLTNLIEQTSMFVPFAVALVFKYRFSFAELSVLLSSNTFWPT